MLKRLLLVIVMLGLSVPVLAGHGFHTLPQADGIVNQMDRSHHQHQDKQIPVSDMGTTANGCVGCIPPTYGVPTIEPVAPFPAMPAPASASTRLRPALLLPDTPPPRA